MDTTNDALFTVGSMQWSRDDFVKAAEDYPDVQEFAEAGKKHLSRFEEFQVDGYHFLHKAYPDIKEESEVDGSVAPHALIFRHIENLAETNTLKGHTVRNKLASLIGTLRFNDIIENLPDDVKNKLKSHEKAQEALQEAQQALQEAQQEQSPEAIEEAEQAVADAEAGISTAAADMQEAIDAGADAIRVAGRSAMQKAAQDVEATEEALQAFSAGTGPGKAQDMSLKEQVAIANAVRDDVGLKEIAELAGRFTRIANRAQRNKPVHGTGEIVDVTRGNRIDLLPSTELCRLAHPNLKLDLYRRLSEHQALNWKKEILETEGMGPIVYVLDESGSMSGYPIKWGKAIGIALYRECAKRKQPFYYIRFGSQESAEKRFEAKPGEELELIAFSKEFLCSGTDYGLALQRAIVGLDTLGWDKADVVFVSDAEFEVVTIKQQVADFREKLKANEASCYGIYIGEKPEYGASTFAPICDRAWGISPKQMSQRGGDIELLKELFADLSPEKRRGTLKHVH